MEPRDAAGVSHRGRERYRGNESHVITTLIGVHME